MYISLTQKTGSSYGGFDCDCIPYQHAEVGAFGKVDRKTEKAWARYIDLLGAFPIVYSERNADIMRLVMNLNAQNKADLKIICYTNDENEPAPDGMRFIGFDVASSAFASVLSGEDCCKLPDVYVKGLLNEYGLFCTREDAERTSIYANSLTANQIEPDFPYRVIWTYAIREPISCSDRI